MTLNFFFFTTNSAHYEHCRFDQFSCHLNHIVLIMNSSMLSLKSSLGIKKMMPGSANKNSANHKSHILNTHTQIAIIGGGFGGIAMAIRLLQQGNQDFLILEKANDFGGTWRENRYPGAACDVQSHMYSLSFAPKTDWSKRYAEAPKYLSYIQNVTREYNLKQFCRFNCEVLSSQYNESTL